MLPLNSSMIVTEPLPAATWAELGWDGCETIHDAAHAYVYLQRTADGRIAIGGRGVPYRFGSAVDHRGATQPAAMGHILRALFPAAARSRIDDRRRLRACPATGARRSPPTRRPGWAGPEVIPATASPPPNLAGHTLADLVTERSTERTPLPWVGHRAHRWNRNRGAGPVSIASTRCTGLGPRRS